jgi:hypothetical protein
VTLKRRARKPRSWLVRGSCQSCERPLPLEKRKSDLNARRHSFEGLRPLVGWLDGPPVFPEISMRMRFKLVCGLDQLERLPDRQLFNRWTSECISSLVVSGASQCRALRALEMSCHCDCSILVYAN